MRVLIFHYVYDLQSAPAFQLDAIARALRARGHRVDVLPRSRKTSDRRQDPAVAREDRLRTLVRYFVHGPANIYYNVPYMRQELKILQERNPDILMTRHSAYNISGVVAAKRLRIPSILFFDGPSCHELRHYDDEHMALPLLPEWMEAYSAREAGALLTISHAMKKYVTLGGADAGKMHVLPNGVDEKTFCPSVDGGGIRRRFGIEDKIVIGFLGSFMPFHAAQELPAILRDLLLDDPRLCVFLVGDGPMRGKTQHAAAQFGVSERFVFAGSVAHADTPAFLSAMDICVIPQTAFYCVPMKILEYMAMGKCVIAPATSPIQEIITHGSDGLLFRPEASSELAHRVHESLATPDHHLTLGRQARETVLRRFTWDRYAQQLEGVLQGVIRP